MGIDGIKENPVILVLIDTDKHNFIYANANKTPVAFGDHILFKGNRNRGRYDQSARTVNATVQ